MPIDSQIMFLKRLVNKFAVICGRVSSEMASTIPTMRRHDTMVRAINIISRYSKVATGRCCERANSRSKAIATIGRRNSEKNTISTILSIPSNSMSLCVMVSIFPKRNEERSGVNPGARKLKMIPIAIPNVQNTAIAESSRISLRLLSHSTPKADSTEKMAAVSRGEIPV